MVTLKQIANRHNMDPHSLRVLLRSTGIRAEGRWVWEDDDPFLAEIEKLVKTHPTPTQLSPKTSAHPLKLVPPPKPVRKDVIVPPASKLIERLDGLASSGKYDDVALAFQYEILIYSWQTHRLRNLGWLLSRGELPIAFIAFKYHGFRLDLRIWESPWQGGSDGSLIAVEWVLCGTPRPEERTDSEINQNWAVTG
jgi:hypothetical protein